MPRIDGVRIGKGGINEEELRNHIGGLSAKLFEGGVKDVKVTLPDIRGLADSWVDEDQLVQRCARRSRCVPPSTACASMSA